MNCYKRLGKLGWTKLLQYFILQVAVVLAKQIIWILNMMTMKKTMMIMNIRMKKKVLMRTKMKKNEKIFFLSLTILKMHAQYDEIKKGQNNHNMVFEITISHSWQFLSSFSKLGSYLYDLHI